MAWTKTDDLILELEELIIRLRKDIRERELTALERRYKTFSKELIKHLEELTK